MLIVLLCAVCVLFLKINNFFEHQKNYLEMSDNGLVYVQKKRGRKEEEITMMIENDERFFFLSFSLKSHTFDW